MKLFKKLDEMELEIRRKGDLAGLTFLNLALIALMLNSIVKKESWCVFAGLIIGEGLVVFISRVLHRRNYGDEGWKKEVVRFSVCFSVVIAVILAVIVPSLTCKKII